MSTTTARNCPDCAAEPGDEHDKECDTARCLATGGQRLGCGGELHDYNGQTYGEHDGPCGKDVWTGYFPADLDAARLGFWCRWVDVINGEPIDFALTRPGRWQECGPGDEGARPNPNRLHPPYAYWDRATCRWEKP